jgi:hypothetical protein
VLSRICGFAQCSAYETEEFAPAARRGDHGAETRSDCHRNGSAVPRIVNAWRCQLFVQLWLLKELSPPQTHRQPGSFRLFARSFHVPFEDDDLSAIRTRKATGLNRKHTAITRNKTSLAQVCQQDNTEQELRQRLTRGVLKKPSTAICDNFSRSGADREMMDCRSAGALPRHQPRLAPNQLRTEKLPRPAKRPAVETSETSRTADSFPDHECRLSYGRQVL